MLRSLRTTAMLTALLITACSVARQGEVPVPAIEVLRTPDSAFRDLPGYPFAPHYADIGGMRMHYVEEGDANAPVVVLLHGEPTWSYLWRESIPRLVEAGYRVIAPDLIGFGRSDKPVRREDYSYAAHVEWVRTLLLDRLDLRDVTLVAHDWGGLIGLRLVAEHPERFARVVVANTALPAPRSADFAPAAFLRWREHSQTVPEFRAGQMLQQFTRRALPDDVVRAYEAPFPDERYRAGARVFPVLVPITPTDPATPANVAAWEVLSRWEKPFVTLFSDSDPITEGVDEVFRSRVPGAAGQPHQLIRNAGHFLQEDAPTQFVDALIAALGPAARER